MLNFDIDMIFRIPALLLALTVHEYAHAVVADSMGDPTPRFMGRLTMNPLKHLDPVGTIMLLFAGFGWAKPVEVNPNYFRNGRKSMMAVSFAGPGSNFLLAFMALFLSAVFSVMGYAKSGIYTFLFWVQLYNIWFALFNLMPIPPLDGSKILLSILPGRYAYEYIKIEQYSFILLIVLVFSGFTGMVLRPLAQFILNSMGFVIGAIFSIFGLF